MQPNRHGLIEIVLLVFASNSALNFFAQEVRNFEFDRAKRSAYMIEKDSCHVSQSALNHIAENLKMTFGISAHNYQTWKSGPKNFQGFSYTFSVMGLTAKAPVDLRSSFGDFLIETGDRICVFGFTSALGRGKRVDRNFSSFLLSAYRQETVPEYNDFPYNFSSLKALSISEFNKRNWLSMAHGLNYLTKRNPFAARSVATIAILYLYEAFHYAAIIGGPVFGKTRSETILLPVTAVLSLAFWKGIVMRHFIAPQYFKVNQRVLKSGYRLPYELNPYDQFD